MAIDTTGIQKAAHHPVKKKCVPTTGTHFYIKKMAAKNLSAP
jgi:hypothetical protein